MRALLLATFFVVAALWAVHWIVARLVILALTLMLLAGCTPTPYTRDIHTIAIDGIDVVVHVEPGDT